MTIELKVPSFPESVTDGVIAAWHKRPGDAIHRDEALVDIETDKVVLEVPAPEDGVLEKILTNEGDTVIADQILGIISTGGPDGRPEAASRMQQEAPPVSRPSAEAGAVPSEESGPGAPAAPMGPAARRLVAQHRADLAQISGTGKDGRVTKGDVLAFIAAQEQEPQPSPPQPEPATARPQPVPVVPLAEETRPQRRVTMTRLRARIAERLLQASQGTAMLTTFNEVNMQAVMNLRRRYGRQFEERHGIRLGIMSFFVHAVAEALKQHPMINASIDGDDIVYHGFCDIGVAVSTERGLVVPVLRDVEYMSLAEIEAAVAGYATRAREGKLSMEEITGGTFTITNGGVFGSLLSTPILNPPQSAILGMHRIQDRAVVENGEIVVRPMMYLALTYDHRLVDGKDAVTFLVSIKERIEDPASLLLDV